MTQVLRARIAAIKKACDELELKIGSPEAKDKLKVLKSELEKFYT